MLYSLFVHKWEKENIGNVCILKAFVGNTAVINGTTNENKNCCKLPDVHILRYCVKQNITYARRTRNNSKLHYKK